MKKLIMGTILLTSAISVVAQGTVYFNNRTAGGTSHVWAGGVWYFQGNGPNDSPPGPINYAALGCNLIGTTGGYLDATTTLAQLLGAPGSNAPESSLIAQIGPAVSFRTGAASGNVVPSIATFNNIPPDAPFATFEMVAWDNSSGLYPTWALASAAYGFAKGRSLPFVVQNIGGLVNSPPDLSPGLTSFNIIPGPEPTTGALAALGAAILLIIHRRK